MRNLWRALPAYLGGKRKLATLIFALLTRHSPSSDWRGRTFVDPTSPTARRWWATL